MPAFKIKSEKFKGSLDSLYQLVESKKLDITEVSLAKVTEQFLDYLKNQTKIEPAEMADFLVVAGRLALMKSRALLPFLKLTSEEENEIQNLKEQLAEYYKFRELAKNIHRLDKTRRVLYSRDYLQNLQLIFYFPSKLKSSALSASLSNLLNTLTLPQRIPQAQAVDTVSLEAKLSEMEKELKEKMEINFSQLLKTGQPEEKAVTFLGVLEFLKRSRVAAEQKNNFGEIKLSWLKNN